MQTSKPLSGRLFGRRKGRPLRVRKSRLIEDLLPRLKITVPHKDVLSLPMLFTHGPQPKVWMEIGFGGGEHLAAQAKKHPTICFLGCEPFLNGVASLLDHLDRDVFANVRIYDGDARDVLDALPDHSLERVFVLFADPWPKSRHAERRFIGQDNLNRLARVLIPGGMLRLASDHPVLIDWMREQVKGHPSFECVYDSATPPADWIPTRYQEKAVTAGRVPVFMDSLKKPSTVA